MLWLSVPLWEKTGVSGCLSKNAQLDGLDEVVAELMLTICFHCLSTKSVTT